MDKFGCKPFILLVCFGDLLRSIGLIINYIFIEHLPLEFFYIDTIYALFGGGPIYFMGMCHYSTDLSLSLDSKSAVVVMPESAKLSSTPFPKNLVPSYQI